VLGVSFGITGIMTNLKLKANFNEFYTENKCMLFVATFGLSIPLIVRGLNDTIAKENDEYHTMIMSHNITFEFLFYVFCELPPLCF
jgi:hypothetical protein